MSVIERILSAPVDVVERALRTPGDAIELANVILTTDDARTGPTPREAVWTHRDITLYRYRSAQRVHEIPILLVFAFINRPEIFDLRPGGSLVEFLLGEGFDVFLLDWGYPDEEDAEMGLADYVCDELHWAIRETLRASGAEELTLLGWCIGATLCAMYCGLDRGGELNPVRNLALLTMPIDGRDSLYARWVGGADFESDRIAEQMRRAPRVDGRLRQQADEAGDELLDDLPSARRAGRRRDRAPRCLSADGEVGRRQPAFPGPRVREGSR